jgi:hypothetical protein
MPAESEAQQQMAAIALHSPGKLKDKSMLSMSKEDLRHYAETKTKGLPKKKKRKKVKKKGIMRLM